MFEQVLQRLLAGLGASDGVIAAMGPTATIILAMVGGGAIAQFLKFPLSRVVLDPWFSWTVRAVAVGSTFALAHFLSATIPWPLELVAGASQPLAYHLSLAAIRRWAPWLEARKFVGSVTPPASAMQAAAQRAADRGTDRTGEGSGV